jgi:hypothetical protein
LIAARASAPWSYRGSTTVGLVLGATLLTAALAAAVVHEQYSNLGLYLVAAAACVFCLVYWRPAVYGVFLVLFVEGYLRNRFGTPNVLILKDMMLAAIYLRVFGGRLLAGRSIVPSTPVNVPLAVFTAIVLIQALNPYVINGEQAIIGLRTWIFYVPLYYVARVMLQTEQEVRRFVWFVLGCAVPICAVAVYQYHLGPSAYASQGEAFASATFVTYGSSAWIYRPNATFSWPSHFAEFLSVAILLSVGMLLGTTGWRRALLWGLLALLVGVELIEGQRASYVLLTPAVALILVLRGKLWTVPLAALTLGVVMLVVGQLTDSAGLERVRELGENRGNVFESHAEAFWSYSVTALENAPIGLGVGATSLGTRYVADAIPLFIEVPLAKVIADLSLVGLVAYLWVFGSLCLTSFRAQVRAARAGAVGCASLLAAILVYQMLATIGGYELAIDALLLWFLSGAAASLAATIADPLESRLGPADLTLPPIRGASR